MRSIALVCGLCFFVGIAYAEDTGYKDLCTKECSFLTKDCTAYLDCRVAKTTCMEDCMQRMVWEKVAVSVDRLTVALEAQAQKDDKQTQVLEELLKNSRSSTQKTETPAAPE